MQIRLNHPENAPMVFSGSLSTFLSLRLDKSVRFRLGDWLRVLDADELSDLIALGKAFREGDHSNQTDDLIATGLIAQATETREQTQQVDEETVRYWVNALYVCASVEMYRREGWVAVDEPLSIQKGADFAVRLTAAGMAHENAIKDHLR